MEGVDGKIGKLDLELRQIREQMKRAKGPAQTQLKQKALRILKQKKMYEQQKERMQQQSFNMEQQNFAIQSMKDTVVTVEAMRSATKEMKKQFKEINVEKGIAYAHAHAFACQRMFTVQR